MAKSDVCDARSSECGCCVHVPSAHLPSAELKGLLSYRDSSLGGIWGWGSIGAEVLQCGALCISGVGRRDAAAHGLSCCREQSELAGCSSQSPASAACTWELPSSRAWKQHSRVLLLGWELCGAVCLWPGNVQHPCVLLGVPATQLPPPAACPISCCGWRGPGASWGWQRGVGGGGPDSKCHCLASKGRTESILLRCTGERCWLLH